MEKSAKGIVGDATAEGPNDERQRIVTKRDGNASDHLRQQAVAKPQDELCSGSSGQPESIHTQTLFAQVLERANLPRALKQVRRNKGAPGIDGMIIDQLPEYLLHRWLEMRAQLATGSYRPRLMARLKSRCPDAPLLQLVNRFRKAGVSVGGQVVPTHLGVAQGGTTQPCGTVGIQFIKPRIRDPYVRWCGREGREASSCLDQA